MGYLQTGLRKGDRVGHTKAYAARLRPKGSAEAVGSQPMAKRPTRLSNLQWDGEGHRDPHDDEGHRGAHYGGCTGQPGIVELAQFLAGIDRLLYAW